ncbi:hypothetical protein [Nitrosomonas marina]|uniref:Uncharacterized protein n=1 Tax=Nitrosomonas marina TaxID=917 RepID=A0A1H8H2U0_9PROT|nr:hypothetical protein [Nitrosomonas marina]SEN50576.1 hypothetical protein SAMN05216325_12133 [Nitrosomonas marina]
MANSSNALWIGGIVIVAALTVVELMSTRENGDATETAGSAAPAGTPAPNSVQQDAGQITAGTIGTPDPIGVPDTKDTTIVPGTDAPGAEFGADSEFASNLIIDLDNPQTNVEAITKDLLHTPEADTTESDTSMAGNDTPVDTSTDAAVDFDTAGDGTRAANSDSVAPAPAASALSGSNDNETQPEQTASPVPSAGTADALAPAQSAEPAQAGTGSTHTTIAQHLAAAEAALKDLRMTTPPGDNAYEHYQAVLAVEPDNAEARAGIQKMVDMYIYFAEKAITDGEENTARVYLQRAEKLSPGSPRLKNLHNELD